MNFLTMVGNRSHKHLQTECLLVVPPETAGVEGGSGVDRGVVRRGEERIMHDLNLKVIPVVNNGEVVNHALRKTII